jgi:D-amino-acid dehydrogenase
MLADAEVRQHGAALRPMTPGHVPIVSKVPEWQNLYLANGGGAKGMLLSVGVAKALEDLIVTGATDMKISGL